MSDLGCQRARATAAPLISGGSPIQGGLRPALLMGLTLAGLHACGGGGGSGSAAASGGSGSWTAGVFQPSSAFSARCAAPRSGTDPYTHMPYPDVAGTSVDENNWLRSWTNELYLWYPEVPDLNPASYTTAQYFPLLKTSALTASGAPKDKFHFIYATAQWEALAQSGVDVGYGVRWVIVQRTPPRSLLVAFAEPGSPAATANLTRGAEVLTVDGADVVKANDNASINTINAGLSPSQVGESHTFSIQDPGAGAPRTVDLPAG